MASSPGGALLPYSSTLAHGKSKVKAKAMMKADATAPPVYLRRRGDKRKALEVATCLDLAAAAMSHYVADWASAVDTSESYWSTWQELHEAYWVHHGYPLEPVLPLTCWRIHVIGS